VFSATALGSVLAAPRVGKLGDRIGARTVVMICLALGALLLIPQAFVTSDWQLIGLRFLMGLALGGLLPSIISVIRLNVPDRVAGYILGYSTSAQFAGQVAGPLMGGFVGAHFGMSAVFLTTSVLMFAGAVVNWFTRRTASPADASKNIAA
jgi:MFS family permease